MRKPLKSRALWRSCKWTCLSTSMSTMHSSATLALGTMSSTLLQRTPWALMTPCMPKRYNNNNTTRATTDVVCLLLCLLISPAAIPNCYVDLQTVGSATKCGKQIATLPLHRLGFCSPLLFASHHRCQGCCGWLHSLCLLLVWGRLQVADQAAGTREWQDCAHLYASQVSAAGAPCASLHHCTQSAHVSTPSSALRSCTG